MKINKEFCFNKASVDEYMCPCCGHYIDEDDFDLHIEGHQTMTEWNMKQKDTYVPAAALWQQILKLINRTEQLEQFKDEVTTHGSLHSHPDSLDGIRHRELWDRILELEKRLDDSEKPDNCPVCHEKFCPCHRCFH